MEGGDGGRGAVRRSAPVLLLPALAAVLCSLPALVNGFIYDDVFIFSTIRAWAADPLGATLNSGDHWYAGRALAYASMALDEKLWGDWAPGFRVTSILLHALTSAAVGGCIARLTRRPSAGIVGGLLFAVHPVHAEAVAQFVNRKDVLATFFLMPALVLWLDPARRPSRWLASLGCVGLALVSKEIVAAGFVPMLLLADLLLRDDPLPRRMRLAALRWSPFALGGLLAGALIWDRIAGVFSASGIYDNTEGAFVAYEHVLRASVAAVPEQLRLLIFPVRLAADYPPPSVTSWSDPTVLLGLGLLAAWHGAALATLRRAPLVAFALLWVSVVYLPCSNVVPLVQFFVAERYLYAPSFGVCLLAGLGVAASLAAARARGSAVERWAVVAAVSLVVLAGGARSAARHRDWRSPEALARSSIAAGVETWRMQRMLGNAMLRAGNLEPAVDALRRAVAIAPEAPLSYYDLATALAESGKVYEAREVVERAEALPRKAAIFGPSRTRLGLALLGQDRTELAAREFEAVLAQEPDNLRALLALAWLKSASRREWLDDPDAAATLAERAEQRVSERWRPYAGLAAAAALAAGGDDDAALTRIEAARDAFAGSTDARMLVRVEALHRELAAGRRLRLGGPQIRELVPGG